MTPLRIALISQEPSATVTDEIIPEAARRGHQVDRIDLSHVLLSEFVRDPAVQKLAEYDLVYYRTSLNPDALAFLEHFLQNQGIPTVNLHFAAHPYINAKTYQVLVAAEAGLLVPVTLYDRISSFEQIAERVGSPFVAKANISSQGRDVHLISSADEFEKLVDEREEKDYFFQSFIPHHGDFRVHVVGDTAPAMYQRQPAPGDFRSNISRGGSFHKVDDDIREILECEALKVAKLVSFEISAIDFMRHTETGEFWFTEINLNPGWQAHNEDYTGVNLTALTLDYFEQIARART